jgi:para-nitrobenzyl esterase
MKKIGRSLFKSLQFNLFKSFLILGLITFVFTGFGYNQGLVFAKSKQFPTLVTTKYGDIEGFYNTEDTVVWKSVPFAKPPVGDLRWKAPQDQEPWSGVLLTTEDCVPCTQLYTTEKWIRQPVAIGNEDCLYLNIYRPNNLKKNLPVYVYIHGGSNNFGTANSYDGSAIASKSGMVVVIVQYRLGPLGWFAQPALRDGDLADDSGNFGTLDNIKALEWIQDNITAFGGNPGNVTITGESAGAHNVMNLVISPLASGMFHRAMSESGGMTTKPTAYAEMMANRHVDALLVFDGTATDLADAAAIRAGMTDEEIADYLHGKEAGDFFLAYLAAYGTLPTYDGVQDGYVIPGSVVSTIRSGNYNKVPIILGANQYETKSFMPLYGPALGLPWYNLILVLDGVIPSVGDVLLNQLDKDLYEVTGYYGSRNWRAKFVDERARALKEQQERVYGYQFNWGGPGSGPSPFDFIYGAGHAMEISFFFGGDTSLWGYGFSPGNDTAGRVDLQEAMMAYLANFAKTGNPNGAGLPVWQKWTNRDGKSKVIIFDANLDEALLSMSDEEVRFDDVAQELAAEIEGWPPFYQFVANYFQWQQPE